MSDLINKNPENTDERLVLAEEKVDKAVSELRKRYPEGSALPASFEELKFRNQDLGLSTLNKWTMLAYKIKARDYLILEGLLHGSVSLDVGQRFINRERHGNHSIESGKNETVVNESAELTVRDVPEEITAGAEEASSEADDNTSALPAGVLYLPGKEPEKIRKRIERLFEKLDSAYPDKVVTRLHVDHKKWGETVTELYRLLGYPDGNAFLNAYGYTTVTAYRKAEDYTDVIDELKRRYENGATCTTVTELSQQNPDLASRFNSLRRQIDLSLKMTLYDYLVQEGILLGKTPDRNEEDYELLRSRYKDKPFAGSVEDLRRENPDIDWSSVSRYYSRSGSSDSFKTFLIKGGIISDSETSTESKLSHLTEELKKRYPEGNRFSGSMEQLKFENKDLPIGSLGNWTKQLHYLSAKEYLVQQGIIKESDNELEKLDAITLTLKERYAEGKQKAYSLTDLKLQNQDISFSSINKWTRDVFGKSATEYLTELGIISVFNWSEYKRQIREEQEAAERALEERLAAEMAVPVEVQYYEPAVYHVDEIDVTGDEAKEWEYSVDYYGHEGQLFIEEYIGERKHIIVPSYINGRKVMGFGPACFSYCKAETIEIPGTIKEVNGTNGYDNDHIKEVIIGEGVEIIRPDFLSAAKALSTVKASKSVKCGYCNYYLDIPFGGTPWFTEQKGSVIIGESLIGANGEGAVLAVPYGVKRISSNIRVNMSNLRKVILPETVTEICSNAFNSGNVRNITEFVIPSSVDTIGVNAFGRTRWVGDREDDIVINNILYACRFSGPTLDIPDGIKAIAGGVFKENKEIRTVVFPKSLKKIGEQAFAECPNLRSVILPEGIEYLEEQCFYNCKKLAKVNFPDSLVSVGRSAFNTCEALSEVILGENIREIGIRAFMSCRKLKTVKLNKKLKRILDQSFSNCNLLNRVELPEGLEKIGKGAFEECLSLSEITIPERIVTIEPSAFKGCINMHHVKLLGKIKEISESAFSDCVHLEDEMFLPPEVGAEAFFNCRSLRKITISADTKEIKKGTFKGCQTIEEMIIPDFVEMIGEEAFNYCSSLKNVRLPKNLRTIGKSAFQNCINLERIEIPETVESIGKNAFMNCDKLSSVAVPETVPLLGLDAFTDTPYLNREFGDFVIISGVLIKYLGSDKDVVIPEEVIVIGENSFAEAYHVESIVIPASVKTLADRVMGETPAFSRDPKKSELKRLVIGDGVVSIGEEAFANCAKLEDVVFGRSLKHLGERAFLNCNELKSIDLSETQITEICKEAFDDCYSVVSVKLPQCIEIIDRDAFSDVRLGKLELPAGVRKVERSAFSGTSELVVYDSIDPDAEEATEWERDEWNGTVNSPLSCALLHVPEGFVEAQGNAGWRDYHITVKSSETGNVRYRIFCDSKEWDIKYRAFMFSAWGKNASFDFETYDDFFMHARNRDGRTEMAFCRIMFPEGLTSSHRYDYESYLERCLYIERSARRTADLIAEKDEADRLRLLSEYGAIDSHNISWIREQLQKANAQKCLEYLDENYPV